MTYTSKLDYDDERRKKGRGGLLPGSRSREIEMTKSEMAERLNSAGAWVPGKKVKIDFGPEGVVLLDGGANAVTEQDAPADTTIKVDWADWQALSEGRLDPMSAFMQGKLRVEGDMSAAMQLQSVFAKLKG